MAIPNCLEFAAIGELLPAVFCLAINSEFVRCPLNAMVEDRNSITITAVIRHIHLCFTMTPSTWGKVYSVWTFT